MGYQDAMITGGTEVCVMPIGVGVAAMRALGESEVDLHQPSVDLNRDFSGREGAAC
jgi:hypothetical protein